MVVQPLLAQEAERCVCCSLPCFAPSSCAALHNTGTAQTLRELHRSCQTEDGADDLKKGTQLLEIYALEIQLHTEQKNNKKLKELYQVGRRPRVCASCLGQHAVASGSTKWVGGWMQVQCLPCCGWD